MKFTRFFKTGKFRLGMTLFLVATLVYSIVHSMASYGDNPAVSGKVIYYYMLHCRIPTGNAFGGKMVSSLFKEDGINDGKDSSVKLEL